MLAYKLKNATKKSRVRFALGSGDADESASAQPLHMDTSFEQAVHRPNQRGYHRDTNSAAMKGESDGAPSALDGSTWRYLAGLKTAI